MFVNYESNNDMVLQDFLSSEGFFGESYRGQADNMQNNDLMDEELQMVLRISLEQEKKRIEEEEKRKLDIQEEDKNNNKIEEESINVIKYNINILYLIFRIKIIKKNLKSF